MLEETEERKVSNSGKPRTSLSCLLPTLALRCLGLCVLLEGPDFPLSPNGVPVCLYGTQARDVSDCLSRAEVLERRGAMAVGDLTAPTPYPSHLGLLESLSGTGDSCATLPENALNIWRRKNILYLFGLMLGWEAEGVGGGVRWGGGGEFFPGPNTN